MPPVKDRNEMCYILNDMVANSLPSTSRIQPPIIWRWRYIISWPPKDFSDRQRRLRRRTVGTGFRPHRKGRKERKSPSGWWRICLAANLEASWTPRFSIFKALDGGADRFSSDTDSRKDALSLL